MESIGFDQCGRLSDLRLDESAFRPHERANGAGGKCHQRHAYRSCVWRLHLRGDSSRNERRGKSFKQLRLLEHSGQPNVSCDGALWHQCSERNEPGWLLSAENSAMNILIVILLLKSPLEIAPVPEPMPPQMSAVEWWSHVFSI